MTMFRVVKSVLVGLATCVLAASEANAAGMVFPPVLNDELKMTAEPMAPGASAIILYRQVDRDDNNGTTEANYLRIKILTEEGRKYANVEIPFLKGFQRVVDLKARTIRPDGSVVDFTGEGFERDLVKARGVKYVAKTFTLPDVRVGCIIEYAYTMFLGPYGLYDSHWILSNELFTRKAQFSLNPYHGGTYVPSSLRWSWRGLPEGVDPVLGHDHIVRMEATNIEAFQVEDYMPPSEELMSRVDFIYEQGLIEKNPDDYWKRIGKGWNASLEAFLGKPKPMEKAVEQIVSPSDSPEVKVRKIYDRVQQIRNNSFALQKTAQEEKRGKEKTIEKAEDVWKFGYGDSVQLTWLFLGLVRATGIEASGCWVSNRRQHFFDPKTMQSSKLDSNIARVKLNGKDVYLDPGVIFTPFGLLTWSETAVPALCLDANGGTWTRSPIPEPSESRTERIGKLKLSDTGDLEGKLIVTYTGLSAMYQRMEERDADEADRRKVMEELVTSQIGMPAEVELTSKPDWTSSETPLVAEFNLKISGFASPAGRRMLIPAAIFTAGEKGIFEHANRIHPIYFDYHYEKSDDMNIQLPEGWGVSDVPAPQDLDEKLATYVLRVEQSPKTLRLTRKLTIAALLMDQKQYPSLRNFFQALRTDDVLQIILEPREAHASN